MSNLDNKPLAGRVALVTGASRGIGQAISVRLASMGADIAVNYIGGAGEADETLRLCREAGVRAEAFLADVSDFARCEAMFAEVEQAMGAPYILVNNAGITKDNLMMRMTAEDFDKVLSVNLKGTFHCTKLACRPMIKAREGRIVSIASVVGIMGNAGQANYAASKAGVIGLTKSAARELAARGITVNAVAPGFIETDMTAVLTEQQRAAMQAQIPLSRLGGVGDIAAAVAFLCSGDAAYITGQVLNVDGGMVMS